MTIAEVIRAVESNNRITRWEAQAKATNDYILASMIVRGVGIAMGSKQTFPTLEEVYSGLFNNSQEEEQQKKRQIQKNNLSTLRFLQFAQSYNQRFKKQEVPKEDK